MDSRGLKPIDVYFAARLAFLDRPDVRLRTYEDYARPGLVVEARSPRAVVSGALDEGFMFDAPRWAARDWAEKLRSEFGYYEGWADTRSADRIADAPRVG